MEIFEFSLQSSRSLGYNMTHAWDGYYRGTFVARNPPQGWPSLLPFKGSKVNKRTNRGLRTEVARTDKCSIEILACDALSPGSTCALTNRP